MHKKKDEEEPDEPEEGEEEEPADDEIKEGEPNFEDISIDGMNMKHLEQLAKMGLMSSMGRGKPSRVESVENIEISFKIGKIVFAKLPEKKEEKEQE